MKLSDDIEGAKILFDIKNKPRGFKKYSTIYASSNENVGAYFKLFDWSNAKDILLSCGSGDQALHAIFYGANNVYMFDINALTKYFFDYKSAAIKALNYQEYQMFLNSINKGDINIELYFFNILSNYLSKESLLFWKELYNYNNLINKKYPLDNRSLFFKICYCRNSFDLLKQRLVYLSNEENYNILRNNLFRTNIYFYNEDITNIPTIKHKFDIIFLSNIADYINNIFPEPCLLNFRHFIINDLKSLLNNNGDIMIAYLYSIDKNGFQYYCGEKEIRDKDNRDLFLSDITTIERFESINNVKEYPYDGILRLKK